jgi:hypothetical protein
MRGSFLPSHPDPMVIKTDPYCKWACSPDTNCKFLMILLLLANCRAAMKRFRLFVAKPR